MNNYEEIQKKLKKKKHIWLITGVAGFIGSNLLEKLLILNQKVVGLDNFETGFQKNIDQAIDYASKAVGKDLSKNFIMFNNDIQDLDICKEACKDVNYVLHQAALGSVPRSIADPIKTNNTNINGFLNMLVASKQANVKQFVYAASSSTYGDSPDLPKIEDRIGNPLSTYAVTKLTNELYAGVFSKNYGFRSVGLRYFNVFGKRQNPNGSYAAVIPKWISSILKEEKVYIYGDGETSRDFCYIDNVIQMNLLAAMLNTENVNNQIYNVALNDRTSLNQLYELIQKITLKFKKNIKLKKPIYKDFRIGDVKHSQADIQKATVLLGYDPKYKINDGLNEAMEWYIDNT